jgi:hypothetical protein
MTADPLHGAARRYLLEPSAPGVFVPGPVCALLNRLALDELRIRQRGAVDAVPELNAVLLAMRLAGLAYVDSLEKVGSRPGTLVDSAREPGAQSTQCGASEAADRLDMTKRAVVKAASSGRLAGQRVAGRWLFTADQLESFRASRRRNRNH